MTGEDLGLQCGCGFIHTLRHFIVPTRGRLIFLKVRRGVHDKQRVTLRVFKHDLHLTALFITMAPKKKAAIGQPGTVAASSSALQVSD